MPLQLCMHSAPPPCNIRLVHATDRLIVYCYPVPEGRSLYYRRKIKNTSDGKKPSIFVCSGAKTYSANPRQRSVACVPAATESKSQETFTTAIAENNKGPSSAPDTECCTPSNYVRTMLHLRQGRYEYSVTRITLVSGIGLSRWCFCTCSKSPALQQAIFGG